MFVSNVSEDGPAYLAGMRPGKDIYYFLFSAPGTLVSFCSNTGGEHLRINGYTLMANTLGLTVCSINVVSLV